MPLATQAGCQERVSFTQAQARPMEITVYVNRSAMVQFDRPLQRVSFAQPAVAEAVVVSPTQLLVNGRAIGTSSMIAWSQSDPNNPLQFTVRVVADIQSIIERVNTLFPQEQIKVEQVDGRVILSGLVSSSRVIADALPLFEGTGLKPVNLTHVAPAGTSQVMLQVRVAEVNRRLLRDLGASYSWWNPLNPRGQNEAIFGPNQFNPPNANFANNPVGPNFTFTDAVNLFLFNPGTSLGAFIRALSSRNAFRSLAEPNIIAVSGEKASFLAGGEFPYPVVQPSASGLAISIQFREFGVRLNFKPTIMDSKRIRLELEPEVSSLDFVNALQLAGFRIPALIVRRAGTTVELADGQSFALAGLLSNDMTKIDSRIPLLGNIPILGYLFRSQAYIKNETELVFLCTARLVKPLEPNEIPPLPGVESSTPLGLEGSFGHQVPASPGQAKSEIRNPK
jgi:pilus assembly protein CpaC